MSVPKNSKVPEPSHWCLCVFLGWEGRKVTCYTYYLQCCIVSNLGKVHMKVVLTFLLLLHHVGSLLRKSTKIPAHNEKMVWWNFLKTFHGLNDLHIWLNLKNLKTHLLGKFYFWLPKNGGVHISKIWLRVGPMSLKPPKLL